MSWPSTYHNLDTNLFDVHPFHKTTCSIKVHNISVLLTLQSKDSVWHIEEIVDEYMINQNLWALTMCQALYWWGNTKESDTCCAHLDYKQLGSKDHIAICFRLSSLKNYWEVWHFNSMNQCAKQRKLIQAHEHDLFQSWTKKHFFLSTYASRLRWPIPAMSELILLLPTPKARPN